MPRSRRSIVRAGVTLLAAPVAGCVSTPDQETADQETTEQYLTGVAPSNRLILKATDDLTVTVTNVDDGTSETYDLDPESRVRVTEFEVSGRIVVEMDGESVWSEQVGSADQYVLTVHPDGEVDVVHRVK